MNQKLITSLAVLLIALLSSFSISAEETSGTCGDSLTWTLQDEVLTISGSGPMTDYTTSNPAPWKNLAFTKVVFDGAITKIGKYAFYYCTKLAEVYIPNSVDLIGKAAFCECNKLTSVTIPKSVTKIDTSLFSCCYNLASITIPNSVVSIGSSAFRECESLTTIDIPNSVTSIGAYAFYYCKALSQVNIPDSVTTIEKSTFYGCRSLTSISIPISVTEIKEEAFMNCSSLVSIIIPDSVTTLGPKAFRQCSNLTSVTLSSSLTEFSSFAFDYCNKIKHVISLNHNPCDLPTSTFTGKVYSSAQLSVPEGSWTSYKKKWDQFYYITDSSNQETTGVCGDNLKWSYADSVLTISGSGPMYDYDFDSNMAPWCKFPLVRVLCEGSMTSIGNYAFEMFRGLTSVDIPNTVTNFGRYAFDNCSSLLSINIPIGVTSISEYAFAHCKSLNSLDIPNTVTSIGNGAFEYCSRLASVEIPNSVTIIGKSSFFCCDSLTFVTIGKSVNSIAGDAFYLSNNIEKVNSLNPEPPTVSDSFFHSTVYANAQLNVPNGSLSAYQSAHGWEKFKNIQEVVPTGTETVANDAVKVTVVGNEISVEGASAGDVMEVYTVSGQLVYSGKARTVAAPAPGIYLVKVAGQTAKVIVK